MPTPAGAPRRPTRRDVRGAALIMAVTLLAPALLVACYSPPTPWTGSDTSPGYRIALAGDSLLVAAETGGGPLEDDPDRYLSDELSAAGHRVSIYGFVGARTSDVADVTFPDPGPQILVVSLGTNDLASSGAPADQVLGNLLTFLDQTAAECSLVLTVEETKGWDLDQTAPGYNGALRSIDASRPDVVLADWAAVVAEHPEYLDTDLVHHTPAGQAAYRALITSTIAAQAPVPGACTPDEATTPTESTTTESTTTEPDTSTTTTVADSPTTEPAASPYGTSGDVEGTS